jgi:hypothetical protein
MNTFSPSAIQTMNVAPAAAPPRYGHPGRVLALLPLIWALNLLDLVFTLLAGTMRDFVELNPLASPLRPFGQTALKLGMLVFCTAIFVALRRRRCVEWGCYLLLAVYGALAAVWLTAFPFLLRPIHLRQLLVSF